MLNILNLKNHKIPPMDMGFIWGQLGEEIEGTRTAVRGGGSS